MLLILSLLFICMHGQGIRIPLESTAAPHQSRMQSTLTPLEDTIRGDSRISHYSTPFQMDLYAANSVFSLTNCKINAFL